MESIDNLRDWLGTGAINIFGMQFAGKDTVGHRLAEMLDARFISSGDVMRATYLHHTAETSEAVWRAAEVGSLSGSLMPTEEFKAMIVDRLSQSDLDGVPLILSTVGRWIGEERPVMDALQSSGHTTKAVILIQISEKEAWRRWEAARDTRNGGRHDDITQETVARRIAEYRQKTIPVIEVYRNQGLLIEINGEQDREKVFSDVIKALDAFSRRTD